MNVTSHARVLTMKAYSSTLNHENMRRPASSNAISDAELADLNMLRKTLSFQADDRDDVCVCMCFEY